MLAKLGALHALVVDEGERRTLARSVRNLDGADFLAPEGLNLYDILKHDTLVLTQSSAKKLEGACHEPPLQT